MMYRIFTAFLFSLGIASAAYAATDTFQINTVISDDVTPPTAPTDLTATPISTSQIDLTWLPATDNTAVTGYQVFRDSVQIATTTGTSYSDTGLLPSTLYTYFVAAFDSVLNISPTSTPAATTTLALPPTPTSTPPTDGGGSSGGIPFPKLVHLEVIPGINSALIIWRTEDNARTTLRWGETSSYELGASIGQFFKKDHQAVIVDLVPSTKYQFMIEGENGYGMEAVLTASSFMTLPPVDVFPPGNVKNLQAVKSGTDDILLTWDNPVDDDFSHVRLLGSDLFYPGDDVDGELIYEGEGERALDLGKAIPDTTQFYTIFSYDHLGNISSGAIVAIRIDKDGVVHIYDPEEIPLAPDEYLLSLSLFDLIFEQEGKILAYTEGMIHLDGSKAFTILLPYEKVPEHLKSIVITLHNSLDEKFSFLLRVNEDRTFYTASVAPLGTSGVFPFSASVFDYSVRKVAQLQGALVSEIALSPDRNAFWDLLWKHSYLLYFIAFLLLLISLGISLIKHARKDPQPLPQ